MTKKRLGPEIAPWGFKTTWPNGYREPGVKVPVLHEYVYGGPGAARELYGEPVEWRPNEPFEAVLRLVSQERGRSAARFIWERESDGAHLPMFFHDMLILAQTSRIVLGRTDALPWYVSKKGTNYGVALLPEVVDSAA